MLTTCQILVENFDCSSLLTSKYVFVMIINAVRKHTNIQLPKFWSSMKDDPSESTQLMTVTKSTT